MSNFVVVGFLTLLLQVRQSHLLYLRSARILNEAAARVTCSGYSVLPSKLMVAKQLHPLQGSLILKPQCDGGADAYKPIIPVGKIFNVYYKGDHSLRCLFKKGTAYTLDIQVVAFGSVVVGTLTVSCPLKMVTAKVNPNPFPPYNLNYKSGSMPASIVGIKCNYDSSVDLTFLPQKRKKILLVSCFKVKFTYTVETTAVKSRAVLDADPFTNCVFRSDIPSVRNGATKWKRDAKTIKGIEVSIFDFSTLACEGTGVIVPCKPPPPTTTTTPVPTTEKFTTQKFTTQQWTTEGFTTEPTPEETTPGPTTTEDFPTEPSTTQTTRPTTSKATTPKATSPKPKPTTPKVTSPKPKPTTPKVTSPKPKPTTLKATTPKPTAPKPTTPKATAPKPTTPKATTPKPTTPKPTPPKATTPKPTTLKVTTPKPTTPKPTTPKPTTPKPTTPKATTPKPTTPKATTRKPTTPKPTTPKATTPKPTTPKATTPKPTTPKATTPKPTTPKATTPKPTTPKPTTPKPTSPKPTTLKATTPKPTTPKPTTPKATTPKPTTLKVTTRKPTTPKPTTPKATSPKPTTPKATTPKPTTTKATTPKPTTPKATTPKPTTLKATTPKPTTPKATTPKPTTPKATTRKPTTRKPTTPRATTPKPTTLKATTPKPTTPKATTPKATTPKPTTPKPTTPKATTPKPTTPKPTAPKATTPKPTIPKATTPKPTTPKATTPKPTTPKATTPKPTSPKATTPKPTSPKATTPKPTTPKATTPKPTSPKATTPKPTTPKATTPKPTSPKATTPKPTTPKATTPKPTTPKPTTPKATTPKATPPKPTTPKATTPKPTTPKATTPKATTPKPTTPKATTPKPTTPKATTPKPTTPKATTPKPTTPKATTPKPTTPKATTPKATTPKATPPKPTTPKPTTPKPTTPKATTPKPTTPKATTPEPTTPKPTMPKATPPPPGFTLNKAATWISCSGSLYGASAIYFSQNLHPLHKLLVLRPSCRGGSDINALPAYRNVYYTGAENRCLFRIQGPLYTIRFDVLAYGTRSIGHLDFHCIAQPLSETPDKPSIFPPYPLRIIPNLIQNVDIDCSKKDSITIQLLPQRSSVVVGLKCQDSTKTFVVNNKPVDVKIWKKASDKRSKCVFRNDVGIQPGVKTPKLNVPVHFFKLVDFSYLGTGSIEPCNENPDKFILDVSSQCGRSTSDAAWVTGISDVDADFLAVCKSGNVFKFHNANGDRVNYRLPVHFSGDASSKCVFNRKGNSQVYVITVKASWGEGSNLIHKSNREYQVTCVYGSRGSDDTRIQSISDRLIAAKTMQENKGPDSVSTIQLEVVDVLGAPVTFMPQGRKVKLSAKSKGEGRELGIRTIGCDAIGTKTKARYAVIRAGCGDGLIFKKNEGFTTNGLTATSPYFKVFAMRDDNLVKFECNFTMCATKCDGSSCSVSRQRRDVLGDNTGIEHAYTRTIRLL
ncbi:uncharacterized protein [Haliotis asinina]|uniref:uncharacterized protein n=1 Tax=Haliotis asinina TaxID=109174 RepID=UPI0035318B56